MRSKFLVLAATAGLSLVFTPCLRADVHEVNKYLGEATELVDKGSMFFEDARGKIELAEASMDDVPEAEKAALRTKIDALKSKIDGAANDQAKKILEGKLKSAMERVEGAIGNLVTWPGAANEAKELLDDPKTATLLGADQVAVYQKQFATFSKLHGSKALKENLAQATTQVDELEKEWAETKAEMTKPDASSNQREVGVENGTRAVENIERFFANLPADNADVKTLRARIDKVKADVGSAASSAGATEVLEYISRFLDSNSDDFAAMEKETTVPTWDSYKKKRDLGCPKTAWFVSRVGDFLANLNDNEQYKAAKDAPAVKAKVDELTKKVDAGRAKVKTFCESVIKGLEEEKVTKATQSDAQMLSHEIRSSLGENSPDGKAMLARVEKLTTDFTNAGDKADADRIAYYKTMTEQANKAWPEMMAKFDVADGFDPNNAGAHKGKYIKLVGNNLMGWRFKPTDFPYATTINGVAVAGKYDPAVKSALSEVEAKLGRSIGDSDDDGEWTAIAKVEGSTGKLVSLVRQEGDVTVDGSKVGTVTGTDERPVEAPIVTIVALKAGPVAVASGQGVVKEDGSVGKPTGSTVGAIGSSSSGGGFSFIPFVMGLFAIVVGAACLMKAKFAPLAGNAGAVQLTEKVGGQNIQYLGLAGIALGAVGVLMNLLALISAPVAALIGIAASLAMIVAGGVAARDLFESRKILPPNVGQLLTQFAVPAGLACAALGLLTVIVSL